MLKIPFRRKTNKTTMNAYASSRTILSSFLHYRTISLLEKYPSLKQTLLSPFYFARYGSVTKLILNVPAANKKTALCQAYVTYTTALEAALAIVVPLMRNRHSTDTNYRIDL